MFRLIIATTLAIATVYYGGAAFTSGTAKAGASTMVSQAQQISAADVLYQTNNGDTHAADVATLVTDGYLQSSPQMPANVGGSLELDSASGLVYAAVATQAVCTQINAQVGVSAIPVADADDVEGYSAAVTQQYGCASFDDSGTDTYHFAYH